MDDKPLALDGQQAQLLNDEIDAAIRARWEPAEVKKP